MTERPKLVPDRYDLQIVDFVLGRKIAYPRKNESILKLEKLPNVSIPNSVGVLFNTQEVWTKVDGIRFTPDLVVKALIERKDGSPKTQGRFSVFIADQKDKISDYWNISPMAAKEKQRHQFWDEPFTIALLTNILHSNQHALSIKNKIAYKLVDNVQKTELIKIRNRFLHDLFG